MQEFSPRSTPHDRFVDRTRLLAVIEPIVRAHGAEVVDFELKSEPGGWVLRVFVEKLGSAEANAPAEQAAIDLELCSQIARDLSPALDVDDPIPHRYNLEISSPGIERPLRDTRDYIRFAGKKAKLKLHSAVNGQKVVVGVLGPLEGDRLTIVDGSRTVLVPLEDISSARLVFEFGPAPKPGKPGKPAKQAQPGKKKHK